MDVIKVVGGRSVTGEVTVEGAKNSALKLMAATIMAPGVTTLTNVPNIADVHVMGKVLKTLGARIEVVGLHELKIDTTDITSWETPYSLVAQMRASTAVLGPLISRFGKAVVAMPGGCNIGARKIDMHILGLEALGVEFKVEHGNIHASAPHGITGETVSLAFASVGATENLMMASVFAKGVTVIDNAAREPEIVDLAITVHGFEPNHLGLVLKKYEQMGITIETGDRWARASRQQDLKAIDIQTLPFPGFPTDMQAQTMTLLALAKGTCIITENVFENRFMLASELSRMGADINLWPREKQSFLPSITSTAVTRDLSRNSSRWEQMLSALPFQTTTLSKDSLCQLNQSMQNCSTTGPHRALRLTLHKILLREVPKVLHQALRPILHRTLQLAALLLAARRQRVTTSVVSVSSESRW